MQKTHANSRAGFSLIELSIVLAVIGLLVGGVMGGQYLVRQAELSSIVLQFNKFSAAYTQFKDQYGGPPGDITDATDYWGTDGVTGGCSAPAPVSADRVPKKTTCNGDGDSIIDTIEIFRTWQQLSNAGLIEGTFTGVAGSSGNTHAVPTENVPAGRISNTGFTLWYIAAQGAGDTSYYENNYGNLIEFGLRGTTVSRGSVLTAREAYNIDLKMDDGKPGQGRLLSHESSINASCGNTNVASTDTYLLTTKGAACSFVYLLGN